MVLVFNHHPSLGPHEGKELELMLQNKKELSLFYTDSEIPEAFLPYIKKGRFYCKVLKHKLFVKDEYVDFEFYIISQEPNTPNVYKLSKALGESLKVKFSPDLEREIGLLLGYNDSDIEYYIQHSLKTHQR
ncbi:hypothetical protein [uncultured Acinetobacter sp.]|uniref:hypothetical protein n=1 Tax=uncultured Acinetobacter sp. TaxID=165433 RepID=UPI0025FA9DC6|nr:hypothetical protein [uncultured Acinetobacter sp.]